MIYLIGINITLFLILLLIVKSKNKHDWILLIWLSFIVIHQTLFYLNHSGKIAEYSFLIGVSIPFPLLHGPFLFIYIRNLIDPQNLRKIPDWIHFLPFLVVNFFLINFYISPAAQKLYIFENDGIGYEVFVLINWILIILSAIVYTFWSLALIKGHQQNIKATFSTIEHIDLRWLQFLVYGLSLVWLTLLAGQEVLTFLGVTIFIVAIGVFGIQQTNIFTTQQLPLVEETAHTSPTSYHKTVISKKKYENSGLSELDLQQLYEKLMQSMKVDKPFLNPELSLSILAKTLAVSPNYLSQVINDKVGMNFYDYINSNRVTEFKQRLHLPKYSHYKLVEIAFDCGFSSKASFNRNFKKITGMTPSAFRDQKK